VAESLPIANVDTQARAPVIMERTKVQSFAYTLCSIVFEQAGILSSVIK
jgi:hypothetical protein